MTVFEKFMEASMGKVDYLKKTYGVSTSEAIELLQLRELDGMESKLTEIHNTLVDGIEANLYGICKKLEK